MSDSSSKVQVSAVNILNLALSQPDVAAGLAPLLQAQESTLLAALSGLLDHSLALLRAKGLVTIMLLCRWGLGAAQQLMPPLGVHFGGWEFGVHTHLGLATPPLHGGSQAIRATSTWG